MNVYKITRVRITCVALANRVKKKTRGWYFEQSAVIVGTVVGSRLQYSGDVLESLKRTLRSDVMLHRMCIVWVTSTYRLLKIYKCIILFKISVRRTRKLQILIVNNSKRGNKQIEFLLKSHHSNVSLSVSVEASDLLRCSL